MKLLSQTGFLAAALFGAVALSNGQTTETKVDVTTKGVAVKRKTQQTTGTKETRVGVGRGGVGIVRKRTVRTVGQSNIKVVMDGEAVAFQGQGPIMQNNSVLVPLRGVFEKMGATLVWDQGTNTVTATRNGQKVVLPIGADSATVDGKSIQLNQPAMVVNGRALVPLRFISESLGAQVGWNASQMTVTVTTA